MVLLSGSNASPRMTLNLEDKDNIQEDHGVATSSDHLILEVENLNLEAGVKSNLQGNQIEKDHGIAISSESLTLIRKLAGDLNLELEQGKHASCNLDFCVFVT